MRRKIKSLIFTEGGRSIGFGHLTRCIALAEALKDKGIHSRFVIRGDSTILGLLRGLDYRDLDWLNNSDKAFEEAAAAELVIVDSYLARPAFYQALSRLRKNIVCLDDHNRLDYPAGTVVNGSVYAESLKYPRKYSRKYLLGPAFALLRREFRAFPRKKINQDIKSVMLTFGGEDIRNTAPVILNFLTRNYPGLRKNVIAGKGFKNIKALQALSDKRTRLLYYPDAKIMKMSMLNADIAISSGGQSLYEFARAGLPTIAICLAQNQEQNVEGWQERGFILCAGWYKDKNLLPKIKECMQSLSSQRIRAKISNIGRKIIDGKGAQRIADFILKGLVKR